jgi:hypothetical protein
MKTKNLLLFIIPITIMNNLKTKSQNAFYMGNDATWVVNVFSYSTTTTCNQPGGCYVLFRYVKDTLYNNTTYKLIRQDKTVSNVSFIYDFMFKDTLNAGYIKPSNYTNAPGKLVDFNVFNKVKGDTIGLGVCVAGNYFNQTSYYQIDSIWSENVNGQSIKRAKIIAGAEYIITEKIGLSTFVDNSCPYLMYNTFFCLTCFSVNDTIYYLRDTSITYFNCTCGSYPGKPVKIRGKCDTISKYQGHWGITGINEIFSSGDNWNIYPNVASDEITVEINEHNYTDECYIEIYSITGNLIKTERISKGENKKNILIKDLSKGLYIISLKENNNSNKKHKKFIKE